MSQENAVGPDRKRRWPKILLVVSLALNLLFVGVIAGAMWMRRHGWHGGPRHHAFVGAVHRLKQDLPEDRRKIAEAVIERFRTEVRPMRREVHQARRAIGEAVKSDPFDEAGFKQALKDVHAANTRMRQRMAAIGLELMKSLNVEERRAFLRTLRSGRYRGH